VLGPGAAGELEESIDMTAALPELGAREVVARFCDAGRGVVGGSKLASGLCGGRSLNCGHLDGAMPNRMCTMSKTASL